MLLYTEEGAHAYPLLPLAVILREGRQGISHTSLEVVEVVEEDMQQQVICLVRRCSS